MIQEICPGIKLDYKEEEEENFDLREDHGWRFSGGSAKLFLLFSSVEPEGMGSLYLFIDFPELLCRLCDHFVSKSYSVKEVNV